MIPFPRIHFLTDKTFHIKLPFLKCFNQSDISLAKTKENFRFENADKRLCPLSFFNASELGWKFLVYL
jgi:hypothetical protein